MSLAAPDAGKLLTVVIPTLNSAGTLDQTLSSLCAAGEIRVIVCDSFSTDGTLDICNRWNVEVVSFPPGNMYAAINQGLRRADTPWLAYVNSDDWVYTSAYRKMLAKAAARSSDIVYGGADYVDGSGRLLFYFRPSPGNAAPGILRAGYQPFCQPATLFRRDVYEALNGFDERYRAASDFDFFCRAALSNRTFSRVITDPVAAFRLHNRQLSVTKPHLDRDERAAMKGRLNIGRSMADRRAAFSWRLSNIPCYAARILRTWQLSGKLRLEKSSTPQCYDER